MNQTTDFYNAVLAHAKTTKYGDDIDLRHIFKNYRNNKGLNLTRFGLFVLTDMGFESESFPQPNDVKFTGKLRVLLDRYNQYPYYIDRKQLILFNTEDRILYKLYGHDLQAWAEHMEENLKQ